MKTALKLPRHHHIHSPLDLNTAQSFERIADKRHVEMGLALRRGTRVTRVSAAIVYNLK